MIVRHGSWLSLVLTVRQGTMLRVIWLRLTLATALAALVTWSHHAGYAPDLQMTIAPFSIIGVALSIFLGPLSGVLGVADARAVFTISTTDADIHAVTPVGDVTGDGVNNVWHIAAP